MTKNDAFACREYTKAGLVAATAGIQRAQRWEVGTWGGTRWDPPGGLETSFLATLTEGSTLLHLITFPTECKIKIMTELLFNMAYAF